MRTCRERFCSHLRCCSRCIILIGQCHHVSVMSCLQFFMRTDTLYTMPYKATHTHRTPHGTPHQFLRSYDIFDSYWLSSTHQHFWLSRPTPQVYGIYDHRVECAEGLSCAPVTFSGNMEALTWSTMKAMVHNKGDGSWQNQSL